MLVLSFQSSKFQIFSIQYFITFQLSVVIKLLLIKIVIKKNEKLLLKKKKKHTHTIKGIDVIPLPLKIKIGEKDNVGAGVAYIQYFF